MTLQHIGLYSHHCISVVTSINAYRWIYNHWIYIYIYIYANTYYVYIYIYHCIIYHCVNVNLELIVIRWVGTGMNLPVVIAHIAWINVPHICSLLSERPIYLCGGIMKDRRALVDISNPPSHSLSPRTTDTQSVTAVYNSATVCTRTAPVPSMDKVWGIR